MKFVFRRKFFFPFLVVKTLDIQELDGLPIVGVPGGEGDGLHGGVVVGGTGWDT